MLQCCRNRLPLRLQLYACPVDNVLCSVPLIQCYLNGIMATPSIPFRTATGLQILPEDSTDSSLDSGTRSSPFEINIWMGL